MWTLAAIGIASYGALGHETTCVLRMHTSLAICIYIYLQ